MAENTWSIVGAFLLGVIFSPKLRTILPGIFPMQNMAGNRWDSNIDRGYKEMPPKGMNRAEYMDWANRNRYFGSMQHGMWREQ